MDSLVFAAVLFAAAAHAGWNATIKRGLDPLLTTVLIAIGAGVVALPMLPFVGLPSAAARPWVVASVLIHLGYFAGLIEAYRSGDMSQVYPIARGTAPLLTALISTTWLGERLGLLGWIGLLCLVGGVFMLSLRGGRDLARLDRRALGFALFTALTICAYSVVDGIGARAAGDAAAYTAALFVGNAVIMALYGLARGGPKLFGDMPAVWRQGSRRRRASARLLLGRDLGDDGRADRGRGGAARDQRAVRRADRRRHPEGAAARDPASPPRC